MSIEAEVPSSRQVEDLLYPYRKLVARLRRSDAVTRGDVDQALRQVTELASQILRVERASVWRLADGGGRIECLDLFLRQAGSHEKVAPLERQSTPAYFQALETERCIVAHDAADDPRTRTFDGYLTSNGIGAMLDAPIFLHGEMVGVVCHEHVGPPRHWQLWEELVAGTMADFVALVMEADERHRALAEAERYRRHLEEETALRSVFEAAPVPLMMARGDGTIELFNPRAVEVIGVPQLALKPGTIHGDRFYVDPSERQRILAELAENGVIDGREIQMRTWTGVERWCLASLRTVVFRGAPHVIMGFTEIQAQKEVEARLRDAATRDPLTGIHNRRHFFEVAAKELERSLRYERPLSLAMLDADHFKEKNDRYGHLVGDELLIAFARGAASELRQSDVIARFGGEELVALFPETDIDAAFAVTDRIRKRLGRGPLSTAAGPVAFTCSGGVVTWDRSESLEALVDRADRALYAAKSGGRDRVERG
ncbi:MAG: Diguanylate cyclase/phosphodiesterase domain 1 [Labilithrix sp.]|nr:Diguanylate cyclase/phosphodiesterase domain 1 [Labilithrix sp.]